DSLVYVSIEEFELGSQIVARRADFSSAKITTDANSSIRRSQIFVHGLQIYLPRLHIVRHLTAGEAALRQQTCGILRYSRDGFVAVTKYHNRHIVNLKIDTNPQNIATKRRRKF
ncbi:T-box transcription factor T, partial [Taenia solium]